jgi:hypothetical protein
MAKKAKTKKVTAKKLPTVYLYQSYGTVYQAYERDLVGLTPGTKVMAVKFVPTHIVPDKPSLESL